MTQFIQIHFLTAYPPSNVNRDDLGQPKIATVGNTNRLRISSQCLKRAWRTADFFESALEGHIGVRTKRKGIKIYEKFIANDIDEKKAREWAKLIASQFGKLKAKSKKQDTQRQKNQDLEIEQLAHFSPEEIEGVDELVAQCIKKQTAPEKPDLKLLRKAIKAVDIACFGRMLADATEFNVEAAVQVAHAITTHTADVEEDYFTAVDDLNRGAEDAGAAHIGEAGFGSGLFYGYVCINYDLLKENLSNDATLTKKALAALIECIAKVSPSGKQNSFASRVYTNYMLAEKGTQQPRSLAIAFLEPAQNESVLPNSIAMLEQQRDNINKVYGACCNDEYHLNTHKGNGTLEKLIDFVTSKSPATVKNAKAQTATAEQ